MTSLNIELARHNMVEQQVRPWEVADPRVLDLLSKMPREDYVPDAYRDLAYADLNIPLVHGEIMMPPKIVARLLQALEITSKDRILEVGTGSGYLTSLLATLGSHVVSVDIHTDLSGEAARRLAAHDIRNVTFEVGNAVRGWSSKTPFDVVVLTGSVATLPEALRTHLAPGGRLFAVVGRSPVMAATLVKREHNGRWTETALFETDLPPLTDCGPAPSFVF